MRKRNYVNNKRLYEVICEYKIECNQNKLMNKESPPIPSYIGEAILLIATNLANKSSFFAYSYKDEMISDGVENCLLYLHNFNPDKTNNPFAYFTQIIKFAFIRRIDKEKKQQYIKIKNMKSLMLEDVGDDLYNYAQQDSVFNEVSDEFVRQYENKLTEKKKIAKVSSNTIQQFFE
jgi:hypothetical protein